MPTFVKCPYPQCRRDIDFDSLSKNEWSASYGTVDIVCPHCDRAFTVDMGSSAAM